MTDRCHSCRSDVGTRVQMTRQYQGQVYRRRVCRCCGFGHYTVEVAADGLPTASRRSAGSMNQVRLERGISDAD